MPENDRANSPMIPVSTASGYSDVEDEPSSHPLPSPFIDGREADPTCAPWSTEKCHIEAPPSKNHSQTAGWQPGLWPRFPVLAILSLLGVLACTQTYTGHCQSITNPCAGTVAAIVILDMSDGQPVDNWGKSLGPSVYLAVIAIIANTLLAVALAEGLVISFWRTALNGCTVSCRSQRILQS